MLSMFVEEEGSKICAFVVSKKLIIIIILVLEVNEWSWTIFFRNYVLCVFIVLLKELRQNVIIKLSRVGWCASFRQFVGELYLYLRTFGYLCVIRI